MENTTNIPVAPISIHTARLILDGVCEDMRDPDYQAKFQEWLEDYKRKHPERYERNDA